MDQGVGGEIMGSECLILDFFLRSDQGVTDQGVRVLDFKLFAD